MRIVNKNLKRKINKGIRSRGYVKVRSHEFSFNQSNLNDFKDSYEYMPEDPHLFKGEGERFRRYGRLLVDPGDNTLKIFPHAPFFQAKKFDVLYGDVHRKFPPLTEREIRNPFFQALLKESYEALPIPFEQRQEPYEVSVHMIRIQATPKSAMGRPAPEGIHRDGYSYGSIHLMKRQNVKGAENNIYDLQKNLIDYTTLTKTLDSIYFDDAAIFHGVTPFEQMDESKRATRDMLILLYQPLADSPQKPSTPETVCGL